MTYHRHFKLTESDLSHILRTPGKLALFITVFVIVIFCTIILIKVDLNGGKNVLKINNIASQDKKDNQLVMAENYQAGIKGLLNQYLLARSGQKFSEVKFCDDLVKQTVGQILNLVVPVDFKEFHLKLVVLLDKESRNCSVQSKKVKADLDKEWSGFLEKYEWLNE